MEAFQLEMTFFAPELQGGNLPLSKPKTRVQHEALSDQAWSDEEVSTLRREMLWFSLKGLLDRRAGSAAKTETMDWIYSDEVHPFSFIVCCHDSGINPVSLRDRIVILVKQQTTH